MDDSIFTVPEGYYLSMLDWYENYQDKYDNAFYKSLKNNIPLSQQYVFKPDPKRRPYWSKEAYVVAVPNGRVLGEGGIVISPDNKLFWDVSFEWFKEPHEHTVFLRDTVPEVTYLNETIAVMTHIDSNNYYHWMYEVLPRLLYLERISEKIDRYVLNHSNLPYQTQSLAMLGIPKEKIIKMTEDSHIQAKKLIVCSIPEYASSWACAFLRSNLINQHSRIFHKEFERIFISREGRRAILNEDEVMNVLRKYNFKKVRLEKFPLKKQIEIFSSAKVVIGAHGAGLTNLSFCHKNTKVLEIFPETYLNPVYWLISQFVGIDYDYFLGTGVQHINPKLQKYRFDNITVDCNELEGKLKRLLQK